MQSKTVAKRAFKWMSRRGHANHVYRKAVQVVHHYRAMIPVRSFYTVGARRQGRNETFAGQICIVTERIKGEQQAARPAKVAASHFHWITFYWLPADGLDAKKFLGRSRQTSLGGPTACKSMEMTTFLWHVAWINGLKSWTCTRIVNCLAILFGIKNIGKKSYEKKYLKNHIQHISKQNKQHHTKNKIRTMMISPNIWWDTTHQNGKQQQPKWVFMYANPHKTKTTKPVIMVVIEKFDPLTPPRWGTFQPLAPFAHYKHFRDTHTPKKYHIPCNMMHFRNQK